MIEIRKLQTELDGFTLGPVNLEVSTGRYFVLLGPTGSGKTVLLETLAGIYDASEGNVFVNDCDVLRKPVHRRGLGMVFQRQHLFNHLSVFDNIAYSLRRGRLGRGEIARQVEAVAAEVGAEELLNQRPANLSGGERQRVALARTLIARPKCVLLDEPLSAIDVGGRADMRRLLKSLQHRHQLTVLHVTHDFEDALALADEMAVMDKGLLIESGSAEQLFHKPKTSFVADFLDDGNLLSGTIESSNGVSVFVTEHNRLTLPPQGSVGSAYVLIRPEHIVLSQEPLDSSARNCIAGRISNIITQPAGAMRVEVDAGDMLRVTVLARTVTQMGIKQSDSVYLTFKSTAVHVIGHCGEN